MTKSIKIIFLGDIMGKIGRRAINKELPDIKKKYRPDLVIANCENLAHGFGISESTIFEMQGAGIHYFTGGNHIFDKPQAKAVFASPTCPVIRPANYLGKTPGDGEKIIRIGQKSLLMINLMGQVFIDEKFENPFQVADEILKKYKDEKLAGIFVDFHAEATSEKNGLFHYLNGRVSAIVGTHTHVQTADEQISKDGTAYITDAGMCGMKDGVIGADKENIVRHFVQGQDMAKDMKINDSGPAQINGVYLEINPNTGKATKIQRIVMQTVIH